jgi:hypothetical protein
MLTTPLSLAAFKSSSFLILIQHIVITHKIMMTHPRKASLTGQYYQLALCSIWYFEILYKKIDKVQIVA